MRTPLSYLGLVCLSVVMFMTSCGTEQSQASDHLDYKEVKTMVVDILKTEEAQKALQSSLVENEGIQAQSLNTRQRGQIRMAVKDTLLSPNYEPVLKKLIEDPKFAGELAKSASKENKQLLKALMKDPEYQKDFGDIIKSPDMMKSYLDMMKTPEYRKQLMVVMKDAMNSPLFKLEVMELLKKAVKEELQPPKKDKEGAQKKEDKEQDEESSEESEGGS